jgi:hypothetical protein
LTGRVVIAARDAGAAAALAPVARALVRDGELAVSIVGAEKAVPVFQTHGLPVLAFPERPTADQAAALLRREQATVVLTGTSMEPRYEKSFWVAAERVGLGSVAVLDHWCNYAERFTVERPFDALPGTLAVMDEAAADRLVSEGCPRDRIAVTGQPHFDDVVQGTRTFDREQVRRELGIEVDRVVLVFASEPQARYYGSGPSDPRFLGYTEDDALMAVTRAARTVAPRALLIVKLHPLEAGDAFYDLGDGDAGVETQTIRAYPPEHLIAAADVVLGMTSVFLLEAALTGVPAISVRPGGGDDHFLRVHSDKIVSVTDVETLGDALVAALATQRSRRDQDGGDAGAVDRVVALVHAEARAGVSR